MLKYCKRAVSCALLLMICYTLKAQNVRYVRAASTCLSNCGDSWINAYSDLQDALAEAKSDPSITEIRVAQGTYRPSVSDRSASFNLPGGMDLLGGFIGTGGNPDLRDADLYPTILSGDLNDNDLANFVNYSDNAYHVVTTDGVGSSLTVDGFTIRGGNADNSSNSKQDDGGGWYNSQYKGTSSPTIRNCIFLENRALNDGGAFFNGGSLGTVSPAFVQCTFENNQGKNGGAIYNNGNSNTASPSFSRCLFQENEAAMTGAVLYSFSRAGTDNGTLYPGNVHPSFSNCVFSRNQASDNAGALYFLADGTGGTAISDSDIKSCSFYANDAAVGGAVYLNASNNGANTAQISNCIFWDSRGNTDPLFHYSRAGSGDLPSITIAFSLVDSDNCDNLIRDGVGTVNCSDLLFITNPATPVFTDPNNGNFYLLSDSPAINTGSNTLVNSSLDFVGQSRIQQTTVDMGAVESSSVLPVELGDFQVWAEAETVQLSWLTLTELNNDFFTIEHAVDGIHFSELDQIPGYGTSQELHQYSYTDQHPVAGDNYYRLRQTDYDGTYTYSEIRVATVKSAGKLTAGVYPNPVGRALHIRWNTSSDRPLLFILWDQLGRKVREGTIDLQDGQGQIPDLGEWIPGGIYYLQLEERVFRIVKN